MKPQLIFFFLLAWSPLLFAQSPEDELEELIVGAYFEVVPIDDDLIKKTNALYFKLDRSTPEALRKVYEFKFMLQHLRANFRLAGWRGHQGPELKLPFKADGPNEYPFNIWQRYLGLSIDHYDATGDEIRIGGLTLQPGDFFIADRNTPALDGLLSSFPEGVHVGSHMGMFVILQNGGKRFPAVMEVSERGLRAVPLHTFLDPSYNVYVEQFRVKEPPENWKDSLNRAALILLSKPPRYNLWLTEPSKGDGLTCSTAIDEMLRLTSAPRPQARSRFSENVEKNLKLLGLRQFSVLTPTNFAMDEQFEIRGVLDHGFFKRNVIHETVARGVRDLFDTSTPINPRAFPWSFRLNVMGLQAIERGGWLGRFVLWKEGFTHQNVPSGPAELMALYAALEPKFKRAGSDGENCMSYLARTSNVPFFLTTFENDGYVRANVDHLLKPIRKKLFK